MTRQPAQLVPAGWLSGRDVVARVVAEIHDEAARIGAPELEPLTASHGAMLLIGEALARPEPALAAFILREGQWYAVPAICWSEAWKGFDHADERAPSDLGWTLVNGVLQGAAFGAYEGATAFFEIDSVRAYTDALRASFRARRSAPSIPPPDWAPRVDQTRKDWAKKGGPASNAAEQRIQARGELITDKAVGRELAAMVQEAPVVWVPLPTAASLEASRRS